MKRQAAPGRQRCGGLTSNDLITGDLAARSLGALMRESAAAAVGFLAASIFPAAVLSVTAPLNGELSISSAAATFLVAYQFSAAFTMTRPHFRGNSSSQKAP